MRNFECVVMMALKVLQFAHTSKVIESILNNFQCFFRRHADVASSL